MLRNVAFLILAFFLTEPSFGQKKQDSGENHLFTLSQCLEYAYAHNTLVLNSELDAKISQGQVKQILADGLPQINASASLNDNLKLQQAFLPGSFVGRPQESSVAVPFGVNYGANMGVTLRQLLFDGTFFLGVKAARTVSELYQKTSHLTKVQVTESVTRAYYTVLVSRERLKTLEANRSRLDSLLYQTKEMYANGFAEKIDVDRLEVNANNLKSEEIKTRRMVDFSLQLLKFQMGMQLAEGLELSDKIEKLDANTIKVMVESEEKSYGERPEYAVISTQLMLNKANVKRYQVGYYPNLYANANYGANTGWNNFGDVFDANRWFSFASVGLTLSVPIFDGFRKSAQIQQAKLAVMQSELKIKELELTIDLQTQQAKMTLQNSLEGYQVQERNLELAKNVYEISKAKYQEGVGTAIEVVAAETAYRTASVDYYAALYDAMMAQIDYKKAKGQLLK